MILKNNRRAEVAYAALLQQQASDSSKLQTDQDRKSGDNMEQGS